MQPLTVYKIRHYVNGEEITEFEQALKDTEPLESYNIRSDLPFEGRLFLQITDPRPPAWAAFLAEGIEDLNIPEIERVSGVLFVKIYRDYNQIFAFTFGHGRYLLRPDCFEINYGLRVALNVLYDKLSGDFQPECIKSVGSKTLARNTIRTQRQTDRRATFETFGVDTQRDFLQAVTGAPISSEKWGSRISGSDGVSINSTVSFEGLGDLCRVITQMYSQETYLENFGWIDNWQDIKDPVILEELQEMLVDAIKTGSNNVTVTVPEFVEWDGLSEFYFSFDPGIRFADPEDADLRGALEQGGKLEKLSVNQLRRWRVVTDTVDSNESYKWPLFRCLIGDFTLKGSEYILSEGKFFEIQQEFLEELNSFIESLDVTEHNLLVSPGDIEEGKYNRIAAKSNDSYLLLDTKTVRVDDMTTPIEICDILTADGCFIHVKRNLASSKLSHLFAQGSVSADLLLMSKEYRTAVLKKIREEERASGKSGFSDLFPPSGPDGITPGKYKVSYAIVAKWKNRDLATALPFFSKITLRKHVEDLRRMGYRVSVAPIEYMEKATSDSLNDIYSGWRGTHREIVGAHKKIEKEKKDILSLIKRISKKVDELVSMTDSEKISKTLSEIDEMISSLEEKIDSINVNIKYICGNSPKFLEDRDEDYKELNRLAGEESLTEDEKFALHMLLEECKEEDEDLRRKMGEQERSFQELKNDVQTLIDRYNEVKNP